MSFLCGSCRMLYMDKIIAWVGTGTSVVGSFVVALHLFTVGYMLFLIGSASWLYVGARKRDNALITLNLAFLCANLIGLYNALV